MKKIAFASFIIFLITGLNASPFELGIEFGSPTGISAKLWLDQRSALDFGLGITGDTDRKDYYDNDRIHIHADYQLHRFDLLPVDHGRLGLYYGLGLRLVSGNESDLGVRIPLGAQYDFASAPISLFLELTPVVEITDPGIDIDPALGVRYVFGKRSGGSKGSSKKAVKENKKAEDTDDEDEEKPKVKMQW